MEADEKGPYLKMERVDYRDPDPLAEYGAAKSSAAAAAISAEEGTADNTYAVSEDPNYFTSGAKAIDKTAYTPAQAKDLAIMDEGARAAVTGRAIRETARGLLFWDEENAPVDTVMNGVYAPLGQRCTIYGTVHHEEGTMVLSVDRVESVA